MSQVVMCPSCRKKNRIHENRPQKPVCGHCGAGLPYAGLTIELNDTDFDSYISGSLRPVLVDFWADWCAPCRMMAPVLKDLSASMQNLAVAKVNIDKNRTLSVRFAISSIPTMILFKKGTEITRISGVLNGQDLLARLNPFL